MQPLRKPWMSDKRNQPSRFPGPGSRTPFFPEQASTKNSSHHTRCHSAPGHKSFPSYSSKYSYDHRFGNEDTFFSYTANALHRFSQTLDINAWFLDQLCDAFDAVVHRVRSIRTELSWLPSVVLAASCTRLAQLWSFVRRLDILAPPICPALDGLAAISTAMDGPLGDSVNTPVRSEKTRLRRIYRAVPRTVWVRHWEQSVRRLRASCTFACCLCFIFLFRFFRSLRKRN